MNPGTETDVRIRSPAGIEEIRRGELCRVAICGSEQEADDLPLSEGFTGVFEILEGIAGEHVQGWVEPEHLLDMPRRVCQHRLTVDRDGKHRRHPVAEGMDRRLVASVEQENAHRYDFVVRESFACRISHGHELGKEIRGRCGTPGGDVLPHERGKGDRRPHRPVFDGLIPPRLVDRHHVVRPGEQLRTEAPRHSQKLCNYPDCEGRGKVGDQVEPAAACQAVGQFAGEPLDGQPLLVDLPGQKGRVDETPQPRVPRRLELQQGVLFEIGERPQPLSRLGPAEFRAGRQMENLAAEPPVAEEGIDVVVSPAASVAELSPAEDTAQRPHGLIGRIGVGDEPRMPGIEIDPGVADGEGNRRSHRL